MESNVRNKYVTALKVQGWEWIPLDTGRKYPDGFAVRETDYVFHMLFIEFKSKKTKGKLMDGQVLTIDRLRAKGYKVYKADEGLDFKKFLKEITDESKIRRP